MPEEFSVLKWEGVSYYETGMIPISGISPVLAVQGLGVGVAVVAAGAGVAAAPCVRGAALHPFLDQGMAAGLEKTVQRFARKIPYSRNPSVARRMGLRLQELELDARIFRWDLNQWRHGVSGDEKLTQILGPRFQPFRELFFHWVEVHRGQGLRQPGPELQEIAARNKISFQALRSWWNRFEEWKTSLNLKL